MNDDQNPLSVGEFILMLFLTGIPIVGFILLLVWAFSGGVNSNRKNYARATLILSVIGFVMAGIFSSVLLAALSAVWSAM